MLSVVRRRSRSSFPPADTAGARWAGSGYPSVVEQSRRSLDERVDEQHAAGAEQRARRVEVGERRALSLAGEQCERGAERQQAQRDVDEGRPPPPRPL
jgi:hypothetical protein